MMQRHESLKHIFLAKALNSKIGDFVLLSSEKQQHFQKVLRLNVGDVVGITDGGGRLHEAILERKHGEIGVRIVSILREESMPHETTLIVGLPKNSTMDLCIEKAVECGVTRIIPIETSRSVVKIGDDATKRLLRWNSIIESSLEQSERLWSVSIDSPQKWEDFLVNFGEIDRSEIRCVCVSESRNSIENSDAAIKAAWASLDRAQDKRVVVFVGPEGGFTHSEVDSLRRLGFFPISLGKHVLRVETAVIVSLWTIFLRRGL